MIAIGTETFLIAAGVGDPTLVCLSWATEGGHGLLPAHEAPAWLRDALVRGEHLVGHHVAYDLLVLLREDPTLWPAIVAAYDAGRLHDTRIREQLLDIARGRFRWSELPTPDGTVRRSTVGYTLAELAQRRCGRTLDKTAASFRTRFGTLAARPLDQWPAGARAYATGDAEATLAVYLAQATDEHAAALTTEAAEVRAAFALHVMGTRGLRIDTRAVAQLEHDLHAEQQAARASLAPLGIFRADGTKDLTRLRALVTAAYARTERATPATPAGQPRTTAATLRDSGDLSLEALADAGATEKLLSAFVPALQTAADAAVPLTCRYEPLVESGRTACRGGEHGLNVQQLPRAGGVRECFVPRPGYLFCAVDYDTLELRTLAQSCLDLVGHSEMARALNAGRDLHLEFAATLLGLPYDAALARKLDPAIRAARQQAKAANFGFPGGLGVRTFLAYAWDAYRVRLTEAEGTALRDAWRRRWPEVAEFQRWVGAQLDPTTRTFTARLPRTGFRRGGVEYCDGCNTFFQGLAAAGAKRALWRVARDGAHWGIRPVAFLHDEILAEVPRDGAHEAAEALARLMCEAMQALCPDVKITASPVLMTRWRKSAEAVRDAAGRLVPWDEPVAA